MITHKDHTVHIPRNLKSRFSFCWRSCLTQRDCEGSNALTVRFVSIFALVHCVLLIPKDLANNHQPHKVAQLQFTYPTSLCPIIRLETQSFDGDWWLNCFAWWLGVRRGTQSFVREWRMSVRGGRGEGQRCLSETVEPQSKELFGFGFILELFLFYTRSYVKNVRVKILWTEHPT